MFSQFIQTLIIACMYLFPYKELKTVLQISLRSICNVSSKIEFVNETERFRYTFDVYLPMKEITKMRREVLQVVARARGSPVYY